MLINKKLKERRKQLGLTMKQVSEIVGVSEGTISRWESGDISNMRRDKIALYAKALKVSPIYIMDSNERIESNISEIYTNIYNIPVFETVSAGFGAYASDEIVGYTPVVIDNPADVPDTIAIKVRGDSMYPKIEDGDTIVVRKQASVDSGSVAVVILDGDEGLVKKVEYGADWIELRSFNPEYKTKRFEGAEVLRIRVVGLVRQVIKVL